MTSTNRIWGRLAERVPFLPLPFAVEFLIIGILCALATALRLEVVGVLGAGFPFITFLPVVILTTFLFGARGGLLSAVVTGFLAWFWFLPPAGSFRLDGGSLAALAFYAVTNAALIGFFYWLQWANAALLIEREANSRLAGTRELLFKELQHRVSNNLQMVAGLLTIQRRQLADEGARNALDEAVRRLAVVGRISRQLYDPAGADQLLHGFLDQLARDVIETSTTSAVHHKITGAADVRIAADAAIPLALVVAESIANAIEHGFHGQDDCRLEIRLDQVAGSRLTVEIEDNGRGLPDGFTLAGSDSLGLKIATMLAGQLGGEYSLSPAASRGTLARLVLPLASA